MPRRECVPFRINLQCSNLRVESTFLPFSITMAPLEYAYCGCAYASALQLAGFTVSGPEVTQMLISVELSAC